MVSSLITSNRRSKRKDHSQIGGISTDIFFLYSKGLHLQCVGYNLVMEELKEFFLTQKYWWKGEEIGYPSQVCETGYLY